MLITGVGGTGVITIGQILGMAGHIEGRGVSVLDMTGLAQKGGAVTSHVRFAKAPDDLHAVRIAAGEADAVIGCDLVVAASDDALAKMREGGTRAVVNTHEIMVASAIANRDQQFPTAALVDTVKAAVGAGSLDTIEATRIATALMGDSIATNMFMLGYAFQKGLVPLKLESIEKAVELNGVAVRASLQAFTWGRRAAVDQDAVTKIAFPAEPIPFRPNVAQSLDELIAIRVRDLTAYQNAAYAKRYEALVREVAAAERQKAGGRSGLAEAAARNLYKLMAYKDEYEVARLYTDGAFLAQLRESFDGRLKLKFHLAPPLFAPRDPRTGQLKKLTFGRWMLPAFRMLAKLRFLRGSFLDPFGHTAERKMERQLAADYEATLRHLAAKLDADNHDLAVEIAEVPGSIRGFGHIKEEAVEAARDHESQLRRLFDDPAARARARQQMAAE